MQRRTFLILAGASALAPTWALAATASPVDVVTALYHLYAGPKGDYSSVSFDDRRVAALFTKSLRDAMKAMYARSKKSGDVILDFDPVTDSQDPAVDRLSIASESESVVVATFYSRDDKRVVRYVFKNEGGAWRIDDLSGGQGADKWDLRDIIKPGAK
jgi:hypothetical protein